MNYPRKIMVILLIVFFSAPAFGALVKNDVAYTKDYALIADSAKTLLRAAMHAKLGEEQKIMDMLDSGVMVVVKAGIKVKIMSRADYPILRIRLIRNGIVQDRDLFTASEMLEQSMRPPGP